MKKSTLLFLGILFVSLTLTQQLFSRSFPVPGEDPSGLEQAKSEINVFPNPSDGHFQLNFEYSGKDRIFGKVFDITGKLVKNISEDFVIGDTSVTASVELDSPRSGIYFIRIESGSRILTKKIIIK